MKCKNCGRVMEKVKEKYTDYNRPNLRFKDYGCRVCNIVVTKQHCNCCDHIELFWVDLE